ncbi:thioredoxin family protein, partial [Streptococcus mitis]|uniref:thioredoxin family protein n=1 Tax=Streptococcus mitis TaxID=28037 RepID=UPI0021BA562B
IIDELAVKYSGKAQIGKLNIDDNPNVPTSHNVRGIPTFLIFKNGKLMDKVVGAVQLKTLDDKIQEHM